MAGKRKELVDIYALLQHLRAGDSNRRIKRELGIDRRTAQKYREWAEEYSLLKGSMPPIEELYQLLEETLPSQRPPQSQLTGIPKIYLCFLSWLCFHSDCHIWLVRFHLFHKSVHSHVTPIKSALFQPRFDGTNLYPLLPQLDHQCPVRLDARMIEPTTGEKRKT